VVLNVGHAIFETSELGDSHHVGQNGSQRGQLDRLGCVTFAERDDALGGPSGTLGHQADGPIDGATANPLDGGSDPGLTRPPLGRPPGYTVFTGPLCGVIALGDRDGKLGFWRSGGLLTGRHGWAHDGRGPSRLRLAPLTVLSQGPRLAGMPSKGIEMG
jgi:hypothetical protein